MRSRAVGWCAGLAVFAGAGLWVASQSAWFRLWRVERAIDHAALSAPVFEYRWGGMPYADPSRRTADALSLRVLAGDVEGLPKTAQTQRMAPRLLGRAALLSRDFDTAIVQYRRALLFEPGDSGLNSELSISYAARADAQKRGSRLEMALEFAACALAAPKVPAFVRFNAALLEERASLLRLADEEWGRAVAEE